MRIKLFAAFTLLFFLAGSAHARTKIKVDRRAVTVSSSTVAGTVVVWGEPGSVSGARHVGVKVYNKSQKIMMGGTVREDGSFSVTLPAYGGDKLKLKFATVNGKKESVGLKVPDTPAPAPDASGAIAVMEEAGARLSSADAEAAAKEAAEVEEVLALPPVIDVEPVIPDGATSLPPAAEGEPIVPRTLAPAPFFEEKVLEPAVKEEVVVTGGPAPQPVVEEEPEAGGEVEIKETPAPPRVGEEVKDSAGEAVVPDAPVYTPAPDDKPAAAE